MSALDAIILGMIQGLTEFLPVSSSGHLEIAKAMLGDVPEEGMLMTILLHFATALSTIVIFREDVVDIFRGLFKFKNNEETRFSLMIVLSMIPAAAVGVLLEDQIDSVFSGKLGLVGAMLILTGGLLFVADRARATEGKVTLTRAIIVGIAQAIAILPGISRSGATIGTSVLLGIDRQRAARFSFLMVVPLIFGAMAVKTKDYLEVSSLEEKGLEERTEIILDEVKEDVEMDSVQAKYLRYAIWIKEDMWQSIRSNNDSIAANDIAPVYELKLQDAGFNKEQITQIQEHDLGKIRPAQKTSTLALIVGFIAAFVTGLIACTWMIALVKRSKLKYFSFYCFGVGTIAIIWTFVA